MIPSRRIMVHGLAHALAAAAAAAEAGVATVLTSPPGAAGYAGPAYFRGLFEAARCAYPQAEISLVVDCGEAAGLALAALRDGAPVIRVAVTNDVGARLADIATQCGARMDDCERPDCLDLRDEADPKAACQRWLLAEMA